MTGLHKFFLFVAALLASIGIIFYPVFLQNKIPLSANLLVSTYNPWMQTKFSGWDTGIPNKPTGVDDIKILYPQQQFTHESLLAHVLPVWDPYIFSGNYHLGQGDTGTFYPMFFLFFLLPQPLAWTILIMLEPLLIGIGMYLFLTALLKNEKAAAFGAYAFAFCGIVVVRMTEGLTEGHAFLWLPFALFSIEAFFQRKQLRYVVLLLMFLLFSFLAGWFQYVFYTIIFSLIYAIFRYVQEKNTKSLIIFTPFFLLPLLVLFLIVPGLQTFFDSPRGLQTESSLLTHLMPLQHLVTFIFPDFWGNLGTYNFFGPSVQKESMLFTGIIPFFFGLLAMQFARKNKTILFFTSVFFTSLILGFDNPVSRFIIHLPIPIISSFLPNRIFLFASLALSILSAYGIDMLLTNREKQSYRFPFLVLSIVTIFTLAYVSTLSVIKLLTTKHIFLKPFYDFLLTLSLITNEKQISVELHNIVIPFMFVLLMTGVVLLRRKLSGKVYFLLFILMFAMQFYESEKYLAFSEKQFVFPNTSVFSFLQKNAETNRFISLGEGAILPNFTLPFHVYTPDGVDAMYPKRYGELVAYIQSHGQVINPNRIEVRINPTSKSLFIDNDVYMMRFLQIDGVKYILKLTREKDTHDATGFTGNTDFPLIWQDEKWQIFENKRILPRTFWTNSFIVEKDNKKQLQKLFDPFINPQTIILEQSPKEDIDSSATGNAKITQYAFDFVSIETSSTGTGLVYLSDNFSSAFSAKVDGKDSQLLRANYTFRAIEVPKGHHTITMFYDMKKIVIGFLIAAVTFLVTILGIGLLLWKKIYKW